ncbi:MAG: nSTAND1 domain-containing NTPase, partial [bacterium]
QLEKILSPACRELGFELKVFYRSQANEVIEFINKNKERLIILHFAGHSNNQYLTLDRGELHADGLQIKLAQCPRLKLVFLNGCDNADQVEQFSNNEVANVIGTTELIKDNIALQFSQQFYKAFAEQETTIREAYEQASSDIKSNHREEDITRSYDLSGITKKTIPWFLRSKKTEWKLKEEADYCKQLPPLPPPKELPNSPYKGLAHYTKADAHIFFGRCKNILELLQRLQSSEPVTILHGGTGVGKSSFLFAGLIPRIETYGSEVHSIRFTEIDHNQDILETIFQTKDLAQIEQKMHSQSSFPSVYIFDQVEELFIIENIDKSSNRIPHLLDVLLKALEKIFHDSSNNLKSINAKIIFSIRTEWYGQLESILDENYNLKITNKKINTLSKKNIIETIESVSKEKNLKEKYNISIESNLPDIISNDLLEDEESNIAPMLQIILLRLWRKKSLENNIWLIKDYFCVKKNDLLLSTYIDEEINKISNESWGHGAVESGLVLSILHSHVTEQGTSKRLFHSEFNKLYSHVENRERIINHLERSHLLIEQLPNNIEERITRTSHDSISREISIKYYNSIKPGQIASRLIMEVKKKRGHKIFFDYSSLKILESGKAGMPLPDKEILKAIESSKKHNNLKRSVLLLISFASVGGILLFLLLIYQYTSTKQNNMFEEAYKDYRSIRNSFCNNNKLSNSEIISNYNELIKRLNNIKDKSILLENQYLNMVIKARLYVMANSSRIRLERELNQKSIEELNRAIFYAESANDLFKENKSLKKFKPQNSDSIKYLIAHALSLKHCNQKNKDVYDLIKEINPDFLDRNISKNDTCLFDYYLLLKES